MYGELLTFDDPYSSLPPIDRLEGFRPGGSSLYRRLLVPATVEGARELAWVYNGRGDSHQTAQDRLRPLAGVALPASPRPTPIGPPANAIDERASDIYLILEIIGDFFQELPSRE